MILTKFIIKLNKSQNVFIFLYKKMIRDYNDVKQIYFYEVDITCCKLKFITTVIMADFYVIL